MTEPETKDPRTESSIRGPGSRGMTGKDHTKYFFGAVPMRAFADNRLKRSHLAVLGVISKFDGFGRNGSGCYASQTRIGQLAGCTSTTVSKRVGDLVNWGYLETKRQQDQRRIQYRVIHQTSMSDDSDTCLTGQVSNPDTCPTEQLNRPGYLSCRSNKDIELSSLRDSPKAGDFTKSRLRNSAEARGASAPCAVDRNEPLSDIPIGSLWAYRRRMSEAIRDGNTVSAEHADDVRRVFEFVTDNELGQDIAGAFEDLLFSAEQAAGIEYE